MRFITFALVAILATVALLFSQSAVEAQRFRWRTVCRRSCTNQCVFGVRNRCHNRRVRACTRYVNRAAGCARFAVRRTRYCARQASYCARYSYSNRRYCAAHRRVCVARRNVFRTVCRRHRRGCVSVGTYKKRVCARRGARRCAAFRTTSRRVCKGYTNKCAQHKRYSSTVCKRYGKKCRSVAFRINRNCIRRKNVCAAHKNIKRCSKIQVCKQHRTVRAVRCVRKGPKCVKHVTRKYRKCRKMGRRCVKKVKVARRCVQYGTRVSKPTLKNICTRFAKRKGKKVCVKREQYRCGAVKKVRFCKRFAKAHTRCVRSVAHCKSYKRYTKKVCVRRKIQCLQKKSYSKKICVRRGPKSCKTVKLCTKRVSKCTHFKTTRVSFCKKYANVCTKKERRFHLRCIRMKRSCSKYGTKKHKTCIRFHRPCTKYVTKTFKKCNRYGNICTLRQRIIASRPCTRYANRCARYAVKRIRGRCVQSRRRCVAFRFRAHRYCARARFVRRCAGYGIRTVRRCTRVRACVRRVRRCRRSCRRIRVRGDPHVNENGNEEHTGQFSGFFRLLKDGDVKVHGYYKQVGQGSVINALVVKQNGKTALLRAGESLSVSGDLELKKSGNTFEVNGNKAKLEISYDPQTKSFSVGGKFGGSPKGLLVELDAKKENVAKEQSFGGKVWLSKEEATLKLIAISKCSAEKKGKGEKLCAALKSRKNDFNDCVRDYCLTGMNFVHQYQQNEAAARKL